MAVLGVQLVVTLLAISIMQKFSQRFSFGKWLLCKTGLVYYLHPSDDELRKLSGQIQNKSKEKGKGKRHWEEKDDKIFMIPRNLEIKLETAKIKPYDVVELKFYNEFQWLIDYSIFTVVVYIITEIYCAIYPKGTQEINLSMLWCLLLVGFAFKSLCSVTGLYMWSSEAAAERSLVLMGGSFCFVLSLVLLIIDESNLEIGLDSAYSAFNRSASAFLEHQTLYSEGPASKLILKLCVAVWCGISGALFIFPGLRVSRMHWDALKYCEERIILKSLLYLNLASPFLLSLLWIRPLARHYFTVRIFPGMEKPLLTDNGFNSMRLWLCITMSLLRITTFPSCLQAYLNLAQNRLDSLKKEAGKISNIEIQKRVTYSNSILFVHLYLFCYVSFQVAIIFYYICVVGLQYVSPIILCMSFTLMNKTLGGYEWFGNDSNTEECNVNEEATITLSQLLPSDNTSLNAREHWLVALNSFRQIFSHQVFRGIFGFANWWSQFICFTTLGMGMAYQSYFVDV